MTIFAVSSGAPPAAIAVLRISGPQALSAAAALAGSLPPPRAARLRTLRDPAGEVLDRALVLIFPGPDSATGEDLAELHLHGGKAVVRAVEAALSVMPELRPAEPGEFTRRALANGRIDLTEAEGLADLLTAETEQQRRVALRLAEGALSRKVEGWTTRLLEIAARLEAVLDFSDEDDVPDDALAAIVRDAIELADDLGAALATPSAERIRDGVRVVLAGPPNSGKSSLLNALAGRDAAIVSPIAGTTRDRIEIAVTHAGIAYLLTDTAGLAEYTEDPIEKAGIALAEEAMASADIVLWLGDSAPKHPLAIALHSRCDEHGRSPVEGRLSLSAKTGEGIAALWKELCHRAQRYTPIGDLALHDRHRQLIGESRDALLATCTPDALIVGEHLRTARLAFEKLTGKADGEAMLDALFARFCVGK